MHACEDEEKDDEEATMTVVDDSRPCGEVFNNEDVKAAIANVGKEVEKFRKS